MRAMRAMRFTAYGPPDRLEVVEDAPIPWPSDNQVLVRVRASSVNPIDWQLASGQYRCLVPTRLPAVPGFDLVGEVVQKGAKVSRVGLGERILGVASMYGACAEYAVVEQGRLTRAPDLLDDAEAAALPLAGLTALQCLRDHGGLSLRNSRQRVLVVGASGGVGHFAVQIAHASGAHVAGVCSGPNMALVRGLGADEVFDYRSEQAFGGGYDIILDAVGGRGYLAWRSELAQCGRYVTPNPDAKDVLWTIASRLSGTRKCNAMLFRAKAEDLEVLAQMALRREVRSVVEQTFSLGELARAHRLSMTGRVRGKLVVLCGAS